MRDGSVCPRVPPARRDRREAIAVERSADPTDDCRQLQTREAAAAVIQNEAELLRDISAALAKMGTTSWGLCEECGGAIEPKRLAAVPWARCCLDCQELAELKAAAERERCACGGILA